MRAVLFDLGNTLLDSNDAPLPGAVEVLTAVRDLRDAAGMPVFSGLVSDFGLVDSSDEVETKRQEYYAILRQAGLDTFFLPLHQRVTLSTEVGVFKPDPQIFRAALDRLDPSIDLHHAMFITEKLEHVQAVREWGMMAIHSQGPGQPSGEVAHLTDLIPLLERLSKSAPCCKKRGEAAGRYTSVTTKSKQADATIMAITSSVSSDRLQSRIKSLTDFGTRWTYAPNISQVTDWIREQFRVIGYPEADIRFQEFNVPGAPTQRNVLCGPPGDHPGFVLVCAHYDALSETPSAFTPGADDNASGVAVLLEVAELLRAAPLRRGVLFAAFGGEEQGLFGSSACADIAAAEGWPIDLVLNLDMIAFQDPARPKHIVVEYDQGNRHPGNDAAAQAFGLLMAQAAVDYTNLTVEHTDIWNSDYIPFEAKGYACIGVYEAGHNPAYHKTTDTVARLDMSHIAEVAKMVVATLHLIAR